MGDSVGTSSTPELAEGGELEQQMEEDTRKRRQVSAFHSKSYTSQMWMDGIERSARSGGAASPGSAETTLFRYPLHTATFINRVDLVELTLGKGYAVDELDVKGRTPLQCSSGLGLAAVTKALLAGGADVTLRCSVTGESTLGCAVLGRQVDIARLAIEHGADVNAADPKGDTPLHLATIGDDERMASLLLGRGADVDILDAEGQTPLQRAAAGGQAAVAEVLLIAGADVALLFEQDNFSALNIAAFSGNVDLLRLLVKHGADVNAVCGSGGHTSLHRAALGNKPASIDFLVEAGANVDQDSSRGTTALHLAATGNLAAVRSLVKNGASVSKKCKVHSTPLHAAAACAGSRGTAEVVDLLLRRGADEKAVNIYGKAAVDAIRRAPEADAGPIAREDVERVRQLLANAPANRAWRRRGFLAMCRAHYPTARVGLERETKRSHSAMTAKKDRVSGGPSRAEEDWVGVARMLMGAGSDPISLMGSGAELIFETIVGYL